MTESNFIHAWGGLISDLALLSIVVTAFCIMVSGTKPAEAIKHMGAVLCAVILLLILPQIIFKDWLAMPFWQRLEFAAILIGVGFGPFFISRSLKKHGDRSGR